MTTIHVRFLRPDGVSLLGTPVTSGQVLFSPAVRYDTGSGEMLPVTFAATMNSDVELAGGPWRADITIPDATTYKATRYVTVPASGAYDIEDLTEIDPASLDPAVPLVSADHVALLALQDTVATLSAGASNLDGISDMSPYMRTVNVATSGGAARDLLSAGTSSVNLGTDYGTAADGGTVRDLTYTVADKANDAAVTHNTAPETITGIWAFITTPSISGFYTAEEVDATITSAVAAATITMTTALNGTPLFLFTSAGVYPPRPATGRPIFFRDPTVQPANDGNILGGGGMVPGLDIWFGA